MAYRGHFLPRISRSGVTLGPTLGRNSQDLAYDNIQVTAELTEEVANNTAQMCEQLGNLLQVNVQQLAVGLEQLATQQEQLNVQQELRALTQTHLRVSERQLIQAIATVRQLDTANHRLLRIDASLQDLSGLLGQQNAMIQKSLNQLETRAQELVTRGMVAYNNGWLSDARRDLAAAVDANPYSAIAHLYLAKCHNRLDEKDAATQAYEKCIYYGRHSDPMAASLAYCDLALASLKDRQRERAEQYLALASQARPHDRTVLAACRLQMDMQAKSVSDSTEQAVDSAFADEQVDPEVLLRTLTVTARKQDAELSKLGPALKRWEDRASQVVFQRTISHFYRELDDFVYLAPRVRRWFMDAADGRFLSLGAPLSDLLDWAANVGQGVLERLRLFTHEHNRIMSLHRVLGSWNALLTQMGMLTGELAAKSILVAGHFVGKLNIGLLDLPVVHEDDRILFEINTDEGDTVALSCYYAVFIRNGVDTFAIPLTDFPVLEIADYAAGSGKKGTVISDSRTGQILLQGTTGSITTDSEETIYFIALFKEAASVFTQMHERIQWAVENEDALYSVFLLLHEAALRLDAGTPQQAGDGQPQGDDFEVVDDSDGAADDFEVVQ